MKNKKVNTIAFVLPENGLPVPSVKGGAIETLMTMLIHENEENKLFNFVFISSNNENLKDLKSYDYTDIYHLSPENSIYKLRHFMEKVYIKIGLYFPKMFPRVSKYYRRVYKLLKNYKIEYIISEGTIPDEFLIFAQKFGREKTIIHLHHHFKKESKYDKIFGKTIAISEFISREWNKEFHGETVVLRNCIDMKLFDKRISNSEKEELRTKVGFSELDFVVLFCGRLIPEKGLKELIEAIVNCDDNRIKLLVIGSTNFANGNQGDYVNEILNLISKHSKRINYVGYVPNRELYQYYQIADIQVIPSIWEEAAGLVCLEGMASGLPLIITESGGMVEYVDNTGTIIVKRDSNLVKNLTNEITNLNNNKYICEEMSIKSAKMVEPYSARDYYINFSKMINVWRQGGEKQNE